jgi:NAD(P)H-nitrite reductase large subunit
MTPAGSRLLQRWLEERGVEVVTRGRIERLEPGPRLVTSERTLDADLVILATGVRPNVGFLDGTGAHVDQGLVVDDRMRTTVPRVFAAGDVAQGRDFSTGEWVVHALQPTATEHGRVAALNMTGQDAPYRGSLGMNVLDTAGLVSETFGRWQGVPGGETAESLDEDAYFYTRLCFEGDTLVGAIGIGPGRSLGPIRGLIQTRRRLGAWKERLMQDPTRVTEAFVDTET